MFQGYSQETVDFMWGIRFNNERGWFLVHKDDYQQHLLTPTRELGQAVYEGLSAALPREPLILKVSRIYRDARRLHGQGPYKDHLWFCVRTGDQDWTGRPTFYFEIAPDYYSYGMGFWAASAALITRYRQQIDRDPRPLEKLVRAFNRQEVFQLNGLFRNCIVMLCAISRLTIIFTSFSQHSSAVLRLLSFVRNTLSALRFHCLFFSLSVHMSCILRH